MMLYVIITPFRVSVREPTMNTLIKHAISAYSIDVAPVSTPRNNRPEVDSAPTGDPLW